MSTQTQPVLLRRALTAGQVPAKAEFNLNTFVINPVDGLLFFLDSNSNIQAMPIIPGLTSAEQSIASAATTDLSTVYSPNVQITGTTAITSLGTGKNQRKSVRFAAALTLTYNATSLLTPTGASIVTAAGDTAELSSDSNGNWRVRSYSRADGTPLAIPADVPRAGSVQTFTDAQLKQILANLAIGPAAFCQCTLAYLSTTQISLNPYMGAYVFINGLYRRIPAGGVQLSNTGLAASTNYFIYAYWTGTAVALEASTTARTTDTTWGHQVKNGDPTRTLVGGVATSADSPGQFVYTEGSKLVSSWYNRRNTPFHIPYNSGASTSSTSYVPVGTPMYIWTWADEAIHLTANGYTYVDTAGGYAAVLPYIDGATQGVNASVGVSVAANAYVPVGASYAGVLSDGKHSINWGVLSGSTSYNASFRVDGYGNVRM